MKPIIKNGRELDVPKGPQQRRDLLHLLDRLVGDLNRDEYSDLTGEDYIDLAEAKVILWEVQRRMKTKQMDRDGRIFNAMVKLREFVRDMKPLVGSEAAIMVENADKAERE